MRHWFSQATWEQFWASAVQALATTGLRLAIILIVYWIAKHALFRVVDGTLSRLYNRSAERLGAEDRAKRILTLQTLVRSLIGYVLFFVLILTVLQTLSVNITGILTTAGVAGVAVGFGAQKLVRDVISGFFIVTEDQFAVGDYVTIGQATGVVEEMGLRTTRIRDDKGRVWAIANGDISVVVNHSRGPVATTLDISLPATANVDSVSVAIHEAGANLAQARPDLLTAAPVVEGVAAFDAASITLRIRISARPEKVAAAEMLLRDHIRDVLTEAGILSAPQPAS